MTTSLPQGLLGAQQPRVSSVPQFVSSAGGEAADLAASVGLHLDPWQRHVLDGALGERADGKWSAFEVGLIVSRQNGKGAVLEARELAGLFLFGERLILHSAHEFKTAQEAFRRVLALVDNFDHLRKRVSRVRTSHGEEGIELQTGQRLRFVARSGGSGRGFTGDTIILDEAMVLGPDAMAALLPTLSARPNPQLWYTASAGMATSEQLRRVRDRGLTGTDPGLAWFEWSAPDSADLDDREAWAQANPALGIRIPEEFVERERAAMPEAEFGRERLGIWESVGGAQVIDPDLWEKRKDRNSQTASPVVFCPDISPIRDRGSISLAGLRGDGRRHIEVADARKGTAWMVPWLVERVAKWNPLGVVVDPASPAGVLIPDLQKAGVDPILMSTRDMVQACGFVFDYVVDDKLRHLDDPRLNTALAAGRKRPIGDSGGWVWHRKDSSTDITPLVSATGALWGLESRLPDSPKTLTRVSGRVRSY